ncbi:MAG: transposase, partial [Planctomycetota bacterium]
MPLLSSIAALVALFEILKPVFTQPSFGNYVRLALGWLLTPGRHAVTAALVVTGTSTERHHSAFHRFFSQAKWRPDEIGRHLFVRLLRLVPEGAAVPLALDDTLTCKRGDQIFGVGCHVDAVRSTKGMRIFSFG